MSVIDDELEALWTAAFGQPPAIRASAGCLVDHLLRYLPAAPCYAPYVERVGRDPAAVAAGAADILPHGGPAPEGRDDAAPQRQP